MKSKKAIQHRITQRRADRKNARRRRRPEFRLITKNQKILADKQIYRLKPRVVEKGKNESPSE